MIQPYKAAREDSIHISAELHNKLRHLIEIKDKADIVTKFLMITRCIETCKKLLIIVQNDATLMSKEVMPDLRELIQIVESKNPEMVETGRVIE